MKEIYKIIFLALILIALACVGAITIMNLNGGNQMKNVTVNIDPDVQRVPVQFYITAGEEIVGAVWLGDAFGAFYADATEQGDGTLEIGGLSRFYQPESR